MSCITLTTDLGTKDPYLSSVRAALLHHAPGVDVIDVSHQITKYDIAEAAWTLGQVWRDFPQGSIHIIGVDNGSQTWLGMKYDYHYFLAPDNGILSLLSENRYEALVSIDLKSLTDTLTFALRDILIPAAAHLAKGGSLEILGKTMPSIVERKALMINATPDYIEGYVVSIDSYGNAITNIDRNTFESLLKGREFKIRSRSGHDITEISLNYQDKIKGELLALFGADGWLEIAISEGHAGDLLGHYTGEKIFIEFF
jgi:S-adenosylmethionine hydrolase